MFSLVVLLVASAICDPLEDGLKSTPALLKLFSSYRLKQGHVYSRSEMPKRLRLFRSELKSVVNTNKAHLGWSAGLNFMSDMSSEEKSNFYGLNVTAVAEVENHRMRRSSRMRRQGARPAAVDWRDEGAVTAVKNQAGCGSCWSFAGVAIIESAYQQITEDLTSFSEQEVLNCAYSDRQDKCGANEGGHPLFAVRYVQNSGRLAQESDLAYVGRDDRCRTGALANSFIGARVTGVEWITRGDGTRNAVLDGLVDSPLAVGIHATNNFDRYDSGDFLDLSCRVRRINHAVTAVGYTARSFIIKNSWGADWGDDGYVFMRRVGEACGLTRWAMAVQMVEDDE